MPLLKIVSGGQSGVDQAGLRAARAAGIPTGGWAPLGWLTEDGPSPWLADFGLKECPKPGYPARTEANVRDSDATLWLGRDDTPGYVTTLVACQEYSQPFFAVADGTKPSEVVAWLAEHRVEILNVAGNRESKCPGVGVRVETFLSRVFERLITEP